MNELGKCPECGLCSRECALLRELDESPKKLSERGIGATEAYSCALCGACETVCPAGLSPKMLFAEGRREAVAAGDMNLDEYAYLLPDHENNKMRAYRDVYGISYSDIEAKGSAEICFFPGCTLMTYAPELMRAVYARLQSDCDCSGIIGECCGKPLSLVGAEVRGKQACAELIEKLQARQVRELIMACPGCYYELKELLAEVGIKLRTVYEALGLSATGPMNGERYAVHDSCPDRAEGRFGHQVREMLQARGFSLTEMEHNRQHTICCGSGGMITQFRPDLAEKMIAQRMAEAECAGAEVLVGYCMSCVTKFADAGGPVVRHALSLLLGRDDDFVGVRGSAAQTRKEPRRE